MPPNKPLPGPYDVGPLLTVSGIAWGGGVPPIDEPQLVYLAADTGTAVEASAPRTDYPLCRGGTADLGLSGINSYFGYSYPLPTYPLIAAVQYSDPATPEALPLVWPLEATSTLDAGCAMTVFIGGPFNRYATWTLESGPPEVSNVPPNLIPTTDYLNGSLYSWSAFIGGQAIALTPEYLLQSGSPAALTISPIADIDATAGASVLIPLSVVGEPVAPFYRVSSGPMTVHQVRAETGVYGGPVWYEARMPGQAPGTYPVTIDVANAGNTAWSETTFTVTVT